MMRCLSPLLLRALILAAPCTAGAVTTVHSFSANSLVPDYSLAGLADTRQVVTQVTSITGLQVEVEMSGGWNGDVYAYLSHSSGFCVLLNRPGRSVAAPDGSASSGFSITFDDAAAADIHTAIPGAGFASGLFQPDARNTDPLSALNTSPRSAFLNSFAGLDGNGGWTLFVADVATGEQSTLTGWTLTITGVPEPSTLLLSAAAGGMLCLRRKRR
jgi:subtilisin-like proprotein convertase family protein